MQPYEDCIEALCVYIITYATIYSGMNNAVIIILYIAFIVVASCIVGSGLLTLYDISKFKCVKTAKIVPIEDALEVSYDSERSLASVYEDFTIEEAIIIDTDSD